MKDEYLLLNKETGQYYLDPEQAVRDDVEKHRWKLTWETMKKDKLLYFMLIPMLLTFFFWRYMPMYELLGCFKISTPGVDVADQDFCGFAHFEQLMFSEGSFSTDFWRAFRNTFVLSFYGLLFGFPAPILVALFFNEIKSNLLRSVYQVLTYLPKFMSTVVITTLLTLLLKQRDINSDAGIVSKAIMALNIIPADKGAQGLLNIPEYFRAIYQISGIWETAGYDSIVFFAAIIAVSPTLYEAAQIDGAGKLSQMRYVVLPAILSTVVIMLINRIGSLLSVGYEKVLLLYNPTTWVTADVVSTFAYRVGFSSENAAVASAAEMINNFTGMILVIGANKIARKASNVSLY